MGKGIKYTASVKTAAQAKAVAKAIAADAARRGLQVTKASVRKGK